MVRRRLTARSCTCRTRSREILNFCLRLRVWRLLPVESEPHADNIFFAFGQFGKAVSISSWSFKTEKSWSGWCWPPSEMMSLSARFSSSSSEVNGTDAARGLHGFHDSFHLPRRSSSGVWPFLKVWACVRVGWSCVPHSRNHLRRLPTRAAGCGWFWTVPLWTVSRLWSISMRRRWRTGTLCAG